MQEGNYMRKIIINANVVLENGIIFDGYIKIESGKIIETGKNVCVEKV